MVWNLPPLCMLGFVSEKVKSVFFQSSLDVGAALQELPCPKIPPLTAHGSALSNSTWEMPDFNQTGASWRWLGQESSTPALCCCPASSLPLSPAGSGVNCGTPRAFGIGWGLLCSAGSNQREGRLVHSEPEPPPAHSQLPVCSTQEMTGAALQWKFFTASAKNSSEVKEAGTHS